MSGSAIALRRARSPTAFAANTATTPTAGGRCARTLAEKRRGNEFGESHLYYEPGEILTPLSARSRKRGDAAVPFSELMDELAPGKYSRGEAAQVSYTLVSLSREGRVEK